MSFATRTLNPLHFEDLEPHRFEDLVRQLAYDFRRWKSIEATGRLGSDEGIDIRAIEIVKNEDEEIEPAFEEDRLITSHTERLWIIQCKREKAIPPKKMVRIITDSIPSEGGTLYGFILSAACDFSKKTRDVFYDELRKRGVQEFYLWGKAELEDMLFLPKNDHLLFAYFNVSLAIRKRSLRNQIRAKLILKRKLVRILGDVRKEHHTPVLLIDANDTRYPYKRDIPDFDEFPRWKYYTFLRHEPNHLAFIFRNFFAYVDDNGEKWDTLFDYDNAPAMYSHLLDDDERIKNMEKRDKYWSYWYNKIPEKNRATFYVIKYINYDRILDVDEDGDLYYQGPHIYVEFDREKGPFDPEMLSEYIEFDSHFSRKYSHPTIANRIKFFPKRIPKPEPKQDLPQP